VAFAPAEEPLVEIAQPGAATTGRSEWSVMTDVLTGRAGIVTSMRAHDAIPDEGWSVTESGSRRAMAADDDPLTATVGGHWRYRLKRPGLETDVHAESTVRATADEFLVDLRLRVKVDGAPFAERRWKERIPRRGV
jgi:hypothetical protein